MGLQAFMLYNL